jgi:beta-galactosidase
MAEKTFDGQSTYILTVDSKKNQYIFMADRWKPKDLKDSRYLWLPISFENGIPRCSEWQNEWKIN